MKKLMIIALTMSMLWVSTGAQAEARDYRGRDCSKSSGISISFRYDRGRDRDCDYRRDSCDSRYIRVSTCEPRCEPVRVWCPGYYEYRTEHVVIPGYYDNVWVEPVCELRLSADCRSYVKVVVQEGYYRQVWVSERVECQTVKVWVPGHWEYR